MSGKPKEMWRSVAQLLYSYLPDRTVNWEDGAGVVSLGTPRIGSAWNESGSAFVLKEIGQYLDRWKQRGGDVDPRFPTVVSPDRFTVGTPVGIDASLMSTAHYCRLCFRFLPRGRRTGERLVCPDCNKQTLRQVSYVFVHGCGELVAIKETIPRESSQSPGTIYNAPIRCPQCSDGGILRMDARSDRLSALRVFCSRCSSEVFNRPLARCPRCLRRFYGQQADERRGRLALQSAMRITRHSANNSYYPHSLTLLRLDRPRVVQASEEQAWLENLLPAADRAERVGVGTSLVDLATRIQAAERDGDAALKAELLAQLAVVAQSPTAAPRPPTPPASTPVADDIAQSIRESIALLSSVRRTDSATLGDGYAQPASKLTRSRLKRLGLRKIELVHDLPVVSTTFGYSRRSPDPTYTEIAARELFPTTIRPFPVLDAEAARILSRPHAVGTTPILARQGFHEGLAIYLDHDGVLEWLAALGVALPSGSLQDRLANLMSRLEPVDRYYEDIEKCPTRRLVFGLLHTISHCAMKVLARIAGIEATGLSEYLFLPLLGTVVYSTATLQLGGISATVRHRMFQFLDGLQEEAFRCVYDPDCLFRTGACHGCVHVPEIGCRVFNHGLSRSFLVGKHSAPESDSRDGEVTGYWELTAKA
jgi:hypothetical protein